MIESQKALYTWWRNGDLLIGEINLVLAKMTKNADKGFKVRNVYVYG